MTLQPCKIGPDNIHTIQKDIALFLDPNTGKIIGKIWFTKVHDFIDKTMTLQKSKDLKVDGLQNL